MIPVSHIAHIAHHTPTLSGNGISWINNGKNIIFHSYVSIDMKSNFAVQQK